MYIEVLYLGGASGTTVSHVSDMIGPGGGDLASWIILYVSIYLHTICIYLSTSLSLYIYIYVSVYIYRVVDRKGTDGVGTNGVSANLICFDRGTFWVLPLTYLCLPKSARAYLFPQGPGE